MRRRTPATAVENMLETIRPYARDCQDRVLLRKVGFRYAIRPTLCLEITVLETRPQMAHTRERCTNETHSHRHMHRNSSPAPRESSSGCMPRRPWHQSFIELRSYNKRPVELSCCEPSHRARSLRSPGRPRLIAFPPEQEWASQPIQGCGAGRTAPLGAFAAISEYRALTRAHPCGGPRNSLTTRAGVRENILWTANSL